MSNEPETSGLNDLESALRSLSPRQAQIDRDAILYRAGRATLRRWQIATAVSTMATAILASVLLFRPPTVRTIVISVPAAQPEIVLPEPAVPESLPVPDGPSVALYFHLQDEVLNRGLDGLPPLPAEADSAPPVSAEEGH